MATCMRILRLIGRPRGAATLATGLDIAIAAARTDVETQCDQVLTLDAGPWWDTDAGLFTGTCENDQEFRQLLMRSVHFLDDLGLITRHPSHPAVIKFLPAEAA